MSSRIRPIGRERVDEIFDGNAVDQIDAVTGQVEHVSVDMHAMSVDGDDHRASASLRHVRRLLDAAGQMHLLATHRQDGAGFQNQFETGSAGAMVEDARRFHHILVGYMDAVAVQGPDLQAVVGQLIARVVLRDFQDASDRQFGAAAQILHRGPSMGVQRDAEVGRAVAEYQAHAPAVPDAEYIIFVQSDLLFLGGSTLKPMAIASISSLSLRE